MRDGGLSPMSIAVIIPNTGIDVNKLNTNLESRNILIQTDMVEIQELADNGFVPPISKFCRYKAK
jgi:hypothetical protein